MGGRGRYNLPDDNDLINIIGDLRRRIEALESGTRAGQTSVDKGGLEVASGQFSVGNIVYYGPLDLGSGISNGMLLRRQDLSVAMSLGGGSGDQFLGIYDNSGNLILGDDSESNTGLARPYLPVPWIPSPSSFSPSETTTSGSFVALQSARINQQHPKIYAEIFVQTSASTPGEVRMMNTSLGVQIGGTVAVSGGVSGFIQIGPAAIGGEFGSTLELEVQARRTSGAGSIGVRVFSAYAVQS